jgi:DNA-binding transcriptional ArsR family regulator
MLGGVDGLWAALVEPHRRAVLERLRSRPHTVGELADELGMSQPMTSKHLRVLRDAGLVRVERQAQHRLYAIDADRMATLDAWLAPYRHLWNNRLDALERHLDQEDSA